MTTDNYPTPKGHKLIKQAGRFAIYRSDKPHFGGHYVVVDHEIEGAKRGLCLDAAHDIFRKLCKSFAVSE